MLKSMTGFGASDAEDENYKFHVEIKSVNQRFLDLDFHMPHLFAAWENKMRAVIKKHVVRGKLDIYITFMDKGESQPCINVNKALAKAYQEALSALSEGLVLPKQQDVALISSYPGVLTVEEQYSSLQNSEKSLLEAIEEAVIRLNEMRLLEGENIQKDFLQRLERLRGLVNEVSDLAPEIVEKHRLHLKDVVSKLLENEKIDESRLIQETAVYADRVNYTEEIVRLESHFLQFSQMLEGSAASVGRKLDFLIQEMNRETNTIGSKANDAKAAQIVVEIKSEIEKLREQVQNIE